MNSAALIASRPLIFLIAVLSGLFPLRAQPQTEVRYAFFEGGTLFKWDGIEYGCHVFSDVAPIRNSNDETVMKEKFLNAWKKTLSAANEMENGCQPSGVTLKGPFLSEQRTRTLLRQERIDSQERFSNGDRLYWIVWFLRIS